MGTGWRKWGFPGVVQKQARLGQTSGRLSLRTSLCQGFPTSFPRSSCPSRLTLVTMLPGRTRSNYKSFPYSNPAG